MGLELTTSQMLSERATTRLLQLVSPEGNAFDCFYCPFKNFTFKGERRMHLGILEEAKRNAVHSEKAE
jgi:hypothetical protein